MRLFVKLGLTYQQLIVIACLLLFIGISAFGVISYIHRHYQIVLGHEITSLLKGATESTRVWSKEQRLLVQRLAQDDHVINAVRQLLALPREQNELLSSPAQQEMRTEMRSYLEYGIYEGYFIIAPDNISLASSRDVNVGRLNPITQYPWILDRLWNGEPSLTPIQRAEVPLIKLRGQHANNETMFVGSAIRDEEGNIIALLTLRINPYKTLFPIVEHARFASTGESYVFDFQGRMLSISRYNDDLARIGIIKPWESSATNVMLVDPGYDLTKAEGIQPIKGVRPLTRMATSAISGENGVDLEGYRDFRGVPVVGTWHWDKELGLGFAVEQEVAEAYGLFYLVRATIVTGAIVAALILIFLVLVFASGKRKVDRIQKRLQSIVETASDGIVVIDTYGNIESANPAMVSIFGYSLETLIGGNINVLVPEPYRSLYGNNVGSYLKGRVSDKAGFMTEMKGLRSNGETFPLELTVNQLDLDTGLRFSAVVRDISDRKQAELALKQETAFTRDVLDSLSAHIAVLDDTGDIVLTNRAWNDFVDLHHLADEVRGNGIHYPNIAQHLPVLCSDESIDAVQKLLEMLNGGLETFSMKYPCHTSEEKHWFEMRANRFTHREHTAIVVSHTDITQQVNSELELKEVNDKLRITALVAENTDNAVIVTDLEGLIQWVNLGFTHLSGYTLEEVVGQKPGDLLQGPDTDMLVARRIGEARRAGQRIEGEILNYHKTGTPYWIHFEITPVYDDQQQLVQFVALELDITDEKRLLADLQREKEFTEQANMVLGMTQQALDRTGIGEYWIAANDGRVLRVNDHACTHLGYTREELLTISVPDFDPNFTRENYSKLTAPIYKKGWARVETVHLTREGKRIPVEVIIVYMPDSVMDEPMSICFSIDISERKKAEAAIIKAREEAEQANRAKSTFLATMSHEIRTPLYGVVGTVDMLAHTRLDSTQTDLVNTAKDSAVLLQGIIDDILDFSKIEAGRLELEQLPLSLESVLEKLSESLNHLAIKREVELLVYCDPRLPKVKGDSVRLRQILFNLAGNAIKFSGDLGTRKGRVLLRVLKKAQHNGHVDICLEVIDNGIGMNPEVQKRLFRPFVQGEEQTTRRFGGTGLGLVITQRLVELMGGCIGVESTEGQGSKFTVDISLEEVAETSPPGSTDLQGLTVLLVQGEDDVAWVLKNYLIHAGAEVITSKYEEIIEVCKQHGEGTQEPLVVIDTDGEREFALPLRDKMRNEMKQADLRFVLVDRGRRRFARKQDADSMTVDLNAMSRATLLNAVAVVAGRESPIQEFVDFPDVVQGHTLSIDEAEAQGRLILLADDNATNRKLINQQLQMVGFLAETASDGREALQKWRGGRDYALLLTDCHMPEMDGYELSRTIRNEEGEQKRLPIVAITADALKGTAQKCIASGMDDYMTKPLQLHQLKQMLEKWLPETLQEQAEVKPRQVTESSNEYALDPAVLAGLLGTEDSGMLTEFFHEFLHTSAPTVQQIRDAFEQKNLGELADQAHKLKSSARAVGANMLADCCLALELAGKEANTQAVSQQMKIFYTLYTQVEEWIHQYGKN